MRSLGFEQETQVTGSEGGRVEADAYGFAAAGRGIAIETGTRVRLKPERFSYSRPHLLYHARQGDIGVVSPPSKQSPAMARLYIIVHFEQCGHDHRLLTDEIDIATGA